MARAIELRRPVHIHYEGDRDAKRAPSRSLKIVFVIEVGGMVG